MHAPSATSAPYHAVIPMHILVVDDDVVFGDTLVRALQGKGHAARWVARPAEALQALRQESCIQAVVLDLRLGTESGLCHIAPMLVERPGLRIVLLTGYASVATAVEAIKLGAVHYLAKPASVDEILDGLGLDVGNAQARIPDKPLSVNRLEWEHIQKILLAHGGNLSATARALNMHRRTLQRKLAKRPARDDMS